MLKPHRVLAEKFSSYADEASAFMRRRRHHRRPFVRIQYRAGDGVDLAPDSPEAAPVMDAVRRLLEHTP
jgi:hypothetical protein